MKTVQVHEVHQLAFMPKWFPINCYLVEEEKGLTLIDAGMGFCKTNILKSADVIGKPIEKIIISHAHSDHIGALDSLKAELPKAEIFLPERELPILQGDTSLQDGEGANPLKGGAPKNVTTTPDTLLQDGDQVGSLVAIHTPGHTPGMMSFLDTRSKVVIAADAFQTKGGLAVAGDLKWTFPFPALATWDKRRAIYSAEKLLDLNPSYLAVGHGEMLEAPKDKMVRAISHAKSVLGGMG
ncbi:MBL fold metallo-hydrolase [Pontibacillus salicampi]|uniref:MBL fold metallo-hydrolase n=1 Tax=Pontibacillus salicampi TaxID=1449801 RepID=A0ABV6LKP1_9BACI